MPAKIRLQRHGKKGKAFFHIVIADGRAPRDGKFIEKIGTYNPTTNPATIDMDVDKALTWLQNGAQPTETCRAILSYKGVLFKNHLAIGVRKGALTQDMADAKFEKWLQEKEGKIAKKITSLSSAASEDRKKRLAAESEVRDARAKKIAEKQSAPAAEETAAPAEETPGTESEA